METKVFSMLLSLTLMMTSVQPIFATSDSVPPESNASEIAQEEQLAEDQQKTNPDTNASEQTASQNEQNNDMVQNQKKTNSQEDVEQTNTDPIVTNYEVTSEELGKVHITWELQNANKVKVYISTDKQMTNVSPMSFVDKQSCDVTLPTKDLWKPIYIKIIPFNDSEQGEPIEIEQDIFEEYKPASVKVTDNVFTYEKGVTMPTITVTDNAGRTISMENMKIVGKSSKYPGNNKMTIGYKNKYAGLPNFEIDYTLLPPTPTSITPWWTEQTKMQFFYDVPRLYYSDAGKYVDYVLVQWSTAADFKNAKSKKFYTNQKTSTKSITGLTKNTTYYIRIKSYKGDLSSDWITTSFKTIGSAPSTSTSNATTKKIIQGMRGNKTFTITLPQSAGRTDAHNYIYTITSNRPHLDKFNINYICPTKDCNAVTQIKFTYNSKKATIANALNKKVMKIVKGAKKKKGTRAKVKYVNKQICKTCSYHYAAYKAHKKGNYTKYKHCYDAYGCLVEHKAVCAGYSEAFAAIMTELNIPNTYAHSPNHRWNKVKIGKKWYHVDVTWNDCTHSNKYLLKKSHPKK